MTEVPALEDFSHGTVTLADVRAWHGTSFFEGDDPGTVTDEWAHSLVDLHDDRVATVRFARYCEKVALDIQVRDHLRRRTAAEARRARGYAMKFINDSAAEPTDEDLAEVLAHCVRRPKPEWFPAIRAEVLAWRLETGLMSRLEVD